MKSKQKKLSLALAALISASALAPSAFAQELSYQVKAGDTLWKIASSNSLTVTQLKQWNGLTADSIYAGQTLRLTAPDYQYTVKAGDTVTTIAKAYNLLIADIKIRNGLSSDALNIGKVLYLPAQKGVYATHTVKAGDTLSLISRDYAINLTTLKTINGLTTDTIWIGQVLKLSAPTAPTSTATSATAGSTSTTTTSALGSTGTSTATVSGETASSTQTSTGTAVIYKVEPGDTLTLIAQKYKTTVANIKALNGLTTDIIYIGQELKVTEGSIPARPAPAFLKDGFFPMGQGTYRPYGDTWGDSRLYGGDRTHEGTDIMASIGTPVYASYDGVIERFGWSDLGGWRITIKTGEGYHLYYAHLSKYEAGLSNGATVKKGQKIGYAGNTGYGPVGTAGKFESHLHFGIYDPAWNAVNPYANLRYWETLR